MQGIPQSALVELIAECEELIENSSTNLQRLETDGFDAETVNSIYRDIHTIKGSAQLFGLNTLCVVAHSMEACLDPLRKNKFLLDPSLNDVLLQGLDLITNIFCKVKENSNSDALVIEAKTYVYEVLACTVVRLNGAWDILDEIDFDGLISFLVGVPSDDTVTETETPVQNDPLELGYGFFDDEPNDAPVEQGNDLKDLNSVNKEKIEAMAQETRQPHEFTEQNYTREVVDSSKSSHPNHHEETGSIRVNVSLLDNLMNLVGELVLIRNQVVQHSNTSDDQDFVKLSQRLNVVTSELQNDVMKTRMQPIGNIISKFKRVVRDLSRELGKRIELVTEGDETELDKTLIEAVKDPLTHLVRNCVDHAIELPDDRIASGKRATGTVNIKAYHEGGQVVVEVKDDGKGLHRDTIGKKAVEKGLLDQEALDAMPDRDVQNLVFAPGFSTANKVSNISGRGVGMDVVKTNIEKIGGLVDLSSIPGKETTFKLKIPLTLAIVPALIVRSGDERFAIPQVKVVELVRVEGGESERFDSSKVEFLQGKPVYRLRGNLIPLVDLRESLNLEGERESDFQERMQSGANLVFLTSDDVHFGLIVDEIEDSADIVVKPLSQFLKKLNLYSGATIMGDGDVVLILDVSGLGALSKNDEQDEKRALQLAEEKSKEVSSESIEYIIIDIGAKSQYAMPLILVNRLEVFNEQDLEWSGEQPMIRYRGGILPILELPAELGVEHEDQGLHNDFSTVVVNKGERAYGFKVKEILDVVNVTNQIDDSLRDGPGVLGNLLFNEEVLVVVDPLEVINRIQGEFGASAGKGLQGNEKENWKRSVRAGKVLYLAEDSTFFRNQMVKTLTDAGYVVRAYVNGEQAYHALMECHGQGVACVVSDIEMPIMTGLDLVSSWKKSHPDSQLEFIAVTTKSSESDIKKGEKAGFSRYLEKLNAEELIFNVDALVGINEEKFGNGTSNYSA